MSRFLPLLLLLVSAAACHAADHEVKSNVSSASNGISDRLALYEGDRGTSCADFLGDVLQWERRGGDWIDAAGIRFGERPFATASIGAAGAAWNITDLVRRAAEDHRSRVILFLRPVRGSGYASFGSREAKKVTDRPMLVLESVDGHKEILEPTADTHLDCSTYKSLGRTEYLVVSKQQSALLQFALPDWLNGGTLKSARLALSAGTAGGGGGIDIGVFEAAIPPFPAGAEQRGLAAGFRDDEGIARHPDVIFASGFDEGAGWRSRWAKGGMEGEIGVVSDDRSFRFVPLSGSALRAVLKKGSNMGFELRVNLKDHGGEPDELYFRYYLRLGDDWDPEVSGGKLPGLAGTYGKAGWGGRRSDGTEGWSMRGAFVQAFPSDHPLHGLTQIGTYAYHADMSDFFGDIWIWPGALLAKNRWYCIEQYVKMNRPGVGDGIVRAWVDGRLVMDRTKVRMRAVDSLHVETVWLNTYHGGTAVSPYDQHLFIDNVVVARSYVGPLQQTNLSRNPTAK